MVIGRQWLDSYMSALEGDRYGLEIILTHSAETTGVVQNGPRAEGQRERVTTRLLSFEQARRVVQAMDKHRPVDDDGRPYPVAEQGWENAEVFVVPFDYGDDTTPADEPARVVDKRSGQLSFRSAEETPPGLIPVGAEAVRPVTARSRRGPSR